METGAAPLDISDYPYVVGIDFGTTFSGCSYAYLNEDNDIFDIIKWPKQSNPYPKTPTLALYHQNSKSMIAWGQEAFRMSRRASKGLLLSRFKLLLDESLHMQPLQNGLSVVDVISDYLRAFHGYILDELGKAYPGMYTQKRTRYCLTVPAMWTEKAKAIMREAAIRAGIISSTDPLNRLMLISEPEAAALYCEKKSEQFNLRHRQRFMICDAGGGTVDVIVFEIDDSTGKRILREVTKGRGDTCGSTFLDAKMKDYLKNRLNGVENISNNAMDTMIERFIQEVKPQFNGEDDQYLDLPASLGISSIDDESLGIYGGSLTLPVEDLREKVFDPVINKVLDLIEQQLSQSKVKLDAIFLVGGLGQSEYLQGRVHVAFDNRVQKISVPPRGELAVVKGAVYFGLSPNKVSQRVLRHTYGISARERFDPVEHPIEYRVINRGDEPRCDNCFSVFVKKGQRIDVNDWVQKDFHFWYPEDVFINLFTFDGDGPAPRFTTDSQVKKVSTFKIETPELKGVKKDTPVDITIKMYFGLTEIKIDAIIKGETYSFTSNFDLSTQDTLPPPYSTFP